MNGKNYRKHFRSGFTLVELILVMIVITILSAMAISSIMRSQAVFRFNGVDQQVNSLMREARSNAVTGKAQIDYTDYDNDGCRADTGAFPHTAPCPSGPDYVTPANYGVNFTGNTMTLFADMHDSGTEGVFDDPGAGTKIGEYQAGKDIKLKVFQLPPDYSFIRDPAAINTVLYSPIFADTSFNGAVTDFFVFGINDGTVTNRKRCSAIHRFSGVPESTAKTATSDRCKL